jgi:hypothetical protein
MGPQWHRNLDNNKFWVCRLVHCDVAIDFWDKGGFDGMLRDASSRVSIYPCDLGTRSSKVRSH